MGQSIPVRLTTCHRDPDLCVRSWRLLILFSICVPSLKYKAVSFSALVGLVTLTIDLCPFKVVRLYARGVCNIPSNLDVSGTFRCRLISQHLSDASCDLATLTFDLV